MFTTVLTEEVPTESPLPKMLNQSLNTVPADNAAVRRRGGPALAAAVLAVAFVAGCSSTSHRAPVEERKPVLRAATSPAAPAPAAAAGVDGRAAPPAAPSAAEASASKLQLPGWENAGKPGYYTVKPGDTLIRIGLDNGQNWRDIARWSGLDNPNIIEVGQVLRVVPPSATAPATASVVPGAGVASSRPVGGSGAVESRPLDGRPLPPGAVLPPGAAAPTPGAPAAAGASTTAAATAAQPAAAPAPAPTAREAEDELTWAWPAAGPVATAFDDVKSKGLAFSGKAGDPVLAAADGRVVYAGSGLRGYGNLIIVKHNNTYLTAYAHNQALLVKEDQAVRRGQKIAEMGSTEAERVQLHFELRRQGKPIDPARLLPQR